MTSGPASQINSGLKTPFQQKTTIGERRSCNVIEHQQLLWQTYQNSMNHLAWGCREVSS
jgi:hypothetical protein